MAAPAFSWANYLDNGFYSASSVNIGSTGAATSNGAFAAGSLLIAQLTLSGAGFTITPPDGWTIIGAKVSDGNGNDVAWYSHVCDGTETGSFTFSWGTTTNFGWVLACYTGAGVGSIDDDLEEGFQNGGSSTDQVTGSVVPVGTTDLLVLFGESDYAVTKPSDMTSRVASTQNSSTVYTFLADRNLSAAGSVSETFSATLWRYGGYALIALKPLAAAPGGRAIHLKDSWS